MAVVVVAFALTALLIGQGSLAFEAPPEATTSGGKAVSLGPPVQVVLGDRPLATPEELALHPPVHRPQNGFSDEEWNNRHILAAGRSGQPITKAPNIPAEPLTTSKSGALTLETPVAFRGLHETFGTPSDMGLAVNQNFVFQAVNAGIGVWDKNGTLQPGFPKSLNAFFGLPPGAFTTDPRVLYDWINNRFIVVILAEDFANSRGFLLLAVSKASDPRGGWNIYGTQVGVNGTCPDFPTLGQDRQGFYIGINKFSCSVTGMGPFVESEVLLVPKGYVYAGLAPVVWSQSGFSVGGVNIDTLQPANIMNPSDKTRAEFMVNSFNINFGGGSCLNGCNGLVVWAISNQFGFVIGGPPPEFTAVQIPTATTYFMSSNAHQTNGDFSIDTGDARISGGVVYNAGSLFTALSTGCVPQCSPQKGLEETAPAWFEIGVTLNDNDPACSGSFVNKCPQLTGAFLRQEECFQCGGMANNGSAYYPTLQPDPGNNLTMVFNFSDSSSYPGVAFVSRRVTQAQNTMHDAGIILQAGRAFYSQGRWGDYTGAAIDMSNPLLPQIWFSGMFARLDGSWGTQIGMTTNFGPVNAP
jgi:hypothetical protein